MDIEKLKIAEEIVKTAEELVFADDYEYIYDPEHKKHPGGGYIKTENGWSKGKEEEKGESGKSESKTDEEKSNSNKKTIKKQKVKRQDIEEKLKSFPTDKINQISQDVNAPSLLLDILSSNENMNVRNHVAQNKNTNAKTLDKLSDDDSFIVKCSVAKNANTSKETLDKLSDDKNEYVKKNVAMNENATEKTLAKLSEDENPSVSRTVVYNKNTSPETLEYIHDKVMENFMGDDSDNSTIEAIAKHKNTKDDTLDQIAKKWKQGTEIGDAARDNLKARGAYDPEYYGDNKQQQQTPDAFPPSTSQSKPTKVKYKFKGDDKTAPIIRAKFEKGHDEDETDSIYGEMAKFSRDDVAPMGVYHGRTKDQLKADFIKNMNPANYSSPEAFQNAKKRIQALSANDFSRILASIFADEEEEV